MSSMVLATNNPGKAREFNELFANTHYTIILQSEKGVTAAEETGLTFVENALLKARHACQQTGLPALADDSGLAVDALGGAPGIYSARYAGENVSSERHIEKLLQAMKTVKMGERQARFHCALVYLRHAEDPIPMICQASWEGEIALNPSQEGGFGYDPIFYLPKYGKTAAELSKSEKNAISHRGKALKYLLDAFNNVISPAA